MGINRAGGGLIGVFVTATLAIYALNQPKAAPASRGEAVAEQSRLAPGTTTASGGCEQGGELQGPWTALKEYTLLRRRDSWGGAPVKNAEDDHWAFLQSLEPGLHFESVVATVPDPQRTNLSLYLDRSLESLMWAADDAGYTFERYWLPWSAKPDPELPSLADRRCREKELKQRYGEPGLLIFRRRIDDTSGVAAGSPGLLLIFIAGETPTSGINKTTLAKAFAYMQKLGPGEPLRVVGPCFSGSLHALALDFKTLLQESATVRLELVSGQTTKLDAIADFRNTLARYGSRVSYRSTIENDDRASRLFINFIDRRWPQPKEIALLSEDDTVYGTLAKSLVRDASQRQAAPMGEGNNWLSIRYPREISRLRNASQEEPSASSNRSADSVVEGVRSTLKDTLTDDSPANAKDSIGFYSKVQSAASQQVSLLAISSSIRRESVDLAGIIATDVLDSLFLTRFLRLAAPDTRLFSFDSDLLFIKESQVVSFVGTLAVTTYPLISRNQHWTQAQLARGVPRRVAFTSQYAEGTYNACRALLQSGTGKDWDENKRGEFLLEYASPIAPGGDHPPVWLTIVGRDSYWPLALLDDSGIQEPVSTLLQSERPAAVTERLHPESPGTGWALFMSLLISLSLAHCAYIALLGVLAALKPAASPPSLPRRFLIAAKCRLCSVLRVYPKEKVTAFEGPFLMVGTLVLFCCLFMSSIATSRFQQSNSAPQVVLQALGFATLAVLLCTAGWIASHLFVQARLGGPETLKVARFIAIPASLIAVFFCITLARLVYDDEFQTGYFFAYRGFSFSSGVSPLLPLVLLACAYFYWTWMHLRREQMTESRRLFRIRQTELHGAVAPMPYYVNPDDTWCARVVSPEILLPSFAVAIGWLTALRPWHTVRSVESRPYDVLYCLELLLIFYMTTVSWVHLIWGWRHLKTFLQALERNPVRHAFSRLKRQSSWVPLVAQLPEHKLLITSLSCDTLHAIENFQLEGCDATECDRWDKKKAAFAKDAELAHQLSALCEEQIRERALNKRDYAELQVHLESIAATLITQLSQSEWKKGDSDSRRYEVENSGKKDGLSPQAQLLILKEEFIAFRYLMFMRYVFRHLRNFIGFVIAGFVFSVFSLESYPFQGQRWIGFAAVGSFLFLGTGIAYIFAEMDRDAILSRLTETKPNELSRHFLFKMLQYGSIPLLTVLSSQFPWIDKVVAWAVRPALDALH